VARGLLKQSYIENLILLIFSNRYGEFFAVITTSKFIFQRLIVGCNGIPGDGSSRGKKKLELSSLHP
jgi:hypothetical protein